MIKTHKDLEVWKKQLRGSLSIRGSYQFIKRENFIKYLTKYKIYAMAMKDDTIDLLNFEKIK